jgi:mannose-1-phosphate guanylyltransferase
MKAILLAAGYGTRLRPITHTIPKCLVPVRGRPLLMWWIDLLEQHRFDQLLINTHHRAEQVISFVDSIRTRTSLDITVTYETVLLGSAGTLKRNLDFVRNEEWVLVANADNFTNANLSRFVEVHRSFPTACTLGLFHTSRPSSCGIVELDPGGLVISYVEKPEHPRSRLANAGIYCFHPSLIAGFPDTVPLDLGHDVLPALTGQMHGTVLDGFLYDIGTLDDYFLIARGDGV